MTAPRGTGTLRGRVTRADTGGPLARARVTAVPVGANLPGPSALNDMPGTLTDQDGRYELQNVPAGRYSISASKTGFIRGGYGAGSSRLSIAAPIELAAAATLDGLNIAMLPGGAVEGRVLDEFGDPLVNATVRVVRRQYLNGERRIASWDTAPALTDDLGRFRVHGISPGTYYLLANAPQLNLPNMPPGLSQLVVGTNTTGGTYYPGASSLNEAQPLALVAGQEMLGLTFQLVPVPLGRIEGVAYGASGRAFNDGRVYLQLPELPRSLDLKEDGSFSFSDVPVGEYALVIKGDREGLATRVLATAEGSKSTLVVQRMAVVRGRIRFDSGAAPAGVMPQNVRVMLRPVGGPSPDPFTTPEAARADWTFEARELGPVFVRASAPAGWRLKSVLRSGVDVTDTAIDLRNDVDDLEVVLTRRVTTVTGRVVDRSGAPVAHALVVAFVDDPGLWGPFTRHVDGVTASNDGTFTISGLPPGRYLAVAPLDVDSADVMDPDVLEPLRSRGTSFTLGEGEARTIELKAQ